MGPVGYALLADLLVFLHLLVVAFIVSGQVLIVVGALRRWRWIRHPVFRLAHVAAIVVVAGQAVTGVACPLTEWEYELRLRAGQTVETDISFVGRLVHAIIFYEAPPWAFTITYVLFALLVIGTLVLVPPRWRSTRSTP